MMDWIILIPIIIIAGIVFCAGFSLGRSYQKGWLAEQVVKERTRAENAEADARKLAEGLEIALDWWSATSPKPWDEWQQADKDVFNSLLRAAKQAREGGRDDN